MNRPARPALRALAPAALLLLALTGCGGAGDGGASSSASGASGSGAASSSGGAASSDGGASSSAEGAGGSASGSAGAGGASSSDGEWDTAATEAALKEVLGADAKVTVVSAEEARTRLQGADVDVLGSQDADLPAGCAEARDAYTKASAEAVQGVVQGIEADGSAGGTGRSITVTRMDDAEGLRGLMEEAQKACDIEGGASASSSGPSGSGASAEAGITTQEVRIGDAEGTLVQHLSQTFEGQAHASGTPDEQSATRVLSVTDGEVAVTDMSRETTSGEPRSLDEVAEELTPDVEKLLDTARR